MPIKPQKPNLEEIPIKPLKKLPNFDNEEFSQEEIEAD